MCFLICVFLFCAAFGKALEQHGDGAKDVAFRVDDCRGIFEVRLWFYLLYLPLSFLCVPLVFTVPLVADDYGRAQKAKERGAVVVREPYELTDAHGTVVLATVRTVCLNLFFWTK